MSRFSYFATSYQGLNYFSIDFIVNTKIFVEKMVNKKDPIMLRRIYQLMGLIAPDETFTDTKIKAEADPLIFLQRENIKSSEGATGLFLFKNESSSKEKRSIYNNDHPEENLSLP